MQVEIIRVDGKHETHVVKKTDAFGTITRLLGCETTDTVNLRDGRVMLVDDAGWETRAEKTDYGAKLVPVRARKPINPEATRIYLSLCVPGTTHQVAGDVAIVNDEDFA